MYGFKQQNTATIMFNEYTFICEWKQLTSTITEQEPQHLFYVFSKGWQTFSIKC